MGIAKQKVPDLIGSGLLVALGLTFAVGATRYGVYTEGGRLGPGFMPLAAGILLALFGAMVGAEALLRRTPPTAPTGAETLAEQGRERSGYSVPLIFGLTLAAIILIPFLGFLLAFGLLVFALVVFVERFSMPVGIAMCVGAVLMAWLIFSVFLRIPLPGGALGSIFSFAG